MAGDAVWLDVLPSLSKFGTELSKGTTAAAQSAGRASGPAWAKSFEGAAGDAGTAKVVKELEVASKRTAAIVSKQSEAISKARASQKDAAAKVVEAEQKLLEAREKGDPAKIEAAELRLSAARDRSEASAKKTESTEGSLKAAHAEHDTVVGQLEEATKELDGAQKGAAQSAEDQARAIDSVKAGAKTAVVGIAALAAVAVTAGTALFVVGSEFDTMSDTIRVGTGAQGEALDALMDSAKNVATSVPTDLEKAGSTIADLNTRLGLSGTTLETVAAQVLEAGRMFGEDLNIEDVTAAFNAFGVSGDDTSGAMDHLFRVSQATGIGMSELAQKVAAQAPAVQELGFSYEETSSMIGALDKAGLNSEAVLGGMARSLVNLAKEGEQPAAAFQRVVGEIEGFIEAGDSASAIDMAGKVFGTRGASQFIGALESGALSMDDLGKMAAASGDTILGASEDTMSFAEQWQMFKNEVLIKLEPVATRVFDALSTGMAWLKDTGLPVFRDLADTAKEKLQPAFGTIGEYVTGTLIPGFSSLVGWLKKNEEWLIPVAAGVTAMVVAYTAYTTVMAIARGAVVMYTAAQGVLNAVMSANPIGIVVLLLVGLVAAFVVAYKNSETFRNIVQGAWQGIKDAAETAWEGIESVFAWFGDAADAIGLKFAETKDKISVAWQTVKDKLKAGWDWINENVFAPIGAGAQLVSDKFSGAKDGISVAWQTVQDKLKAGWDWIDDKVFSRLRDGLDAIGEAFSTTKDWISRSWRKIANIAREPVNFIIKTVYMDGIKAVWDKIATAVGLTSLKLPTVSRVPAFAEGGILPGYTPGRDIHKFFSPTGGRLDLSGGEGILRPDTLRNLGGKTWLDNTNRLRGRHQAFADGGQVSFWDTVGGVVSGIGSGIKNLVVDVAKVLSDPAGSLKSMLSAPVEALMGQVTGGNLGRMLIEIPRTVISGIIAEAKDLIANLFSDDGEGPLLSSGAWGRPSRGPVTSGYGSRWGAFHNGVDFGGNLPVYAAGAGRVAATGWGVGYGNTGLGVRLSHGGGLETYYGHADPGEIRVRAGQTVAKGQHISWGGNTGNSTGQHLHFSLFQGGRSLNPSQIGVYDTGGYLKPRDVATNYSTKPEPVLTEGQWRDISVLAARGATSGNVPMRLHPADIQALGEVILVGAARVSDGVSRGVLSGAVSDTRRAVRARGGF